MIQYQTIDLYNYSKLHLLQKTINLFNFINYFNNYNYYIFFIKTF